MARKKKQLLTRPGYVTYLRTSSEEVQAPERSQDAQLRDIQSRLIAYCDLSSVGEYRDNYTGTSSDRKEYQRLLAHARQGMFSHVFTATPDRFGRDDVEALRAIDEMTAIGINVRFATHPDLDPSDPDDRLYLNILFGMARRESQITAKRVSGGMLSKLLKGDWPFLAPDGYRNCEAKLTEIDGMTREEYLRHARYKRWVELDPVRAELWRYAWELLLSDKVSLDDICEALASRGYRRRNGQSFVTLDRDTGLLSGRSFLSKTFHNWFYAGWVAVENSFAKIPPKTLQGNWEPMVSTEAFEEGLLILAKRDRKPMPQKKHFYLLQGMIYLQLADGAAVKLTCGRPNLQRTANGVSYYCVPSSAQNFPTSSIDHQIAQHLAQSRIHPDRIPDIRRAYRNDAERNAAHHANEERSLERALQRTKDKELNLWRAFTEHGMHADHYTRLAQEYQDEQRRIQLALSAIQKENKDRIGNLDAALSIIAEIGERYGKQSPVQQREILRHVIRRVVVDEQGKVVRLEYLPPFDYLQGWIDERGTGRKQRNHLSPINKQSSTKAGCSLPVYVSDPFGSYSEPSDGSLIPITAFLSSISFPQCAHLQRLFHHLENSA